MEDPVFKQKYQKYKHRVKLWEKDFKKKHGRIPSKYDIREAPQEIRDSYKMYYKLKTSFLEDTLNDALSEDGFDILEMSQKDESASPNKSINSGPQLPFNITDLVEKHKRSEDSPQLELYNNISHAQDVPEGYDLANALKTNESHVSKEFESVQTLRLNESAWGSHLSRKTPLKVKKEVVQKSLKPSFNEKLFQNSTFSKRNPRKSLLKSSSDLSLRKMQHNSMEKLSISNKDILPDLETILLQKAKEQQSAAIIASNSFLTAEKSKENIRTQLDEGWLERNASPNDVEPNKINNSKGTQCVYGLNNIDISKLKSYSIVEKTTPTPEAASNLELKNSEQTDFQDVSANGINRIQGCQKSHDSDSVVDDSDDEKTSQECRHIIKRSRFSASIVQNLQVKTKEYNVKNIKNEHINSELEYSEKKTPEIKRKRSIAKAPTAKTKTAIVAEKPGARKYNKSNRKTRSTNQGNIDCEDQTKDLDDTPLNPEELKYSLALERGDLTSVPRIKQNDLDSADILAQNYISSGTPSLDSIAVSKPTVSAVDEKRSAARRKLEQKIATGKLNENFVTINIQKKTFVRGKKTINYSKYKKKLWKHKKKIAALSGPNMDMGGCDGGTIKCFNCGQAGHFAQNCKMKGDSLLPLSAEITEDESPFPTLEEAERMASQSAVAVHSRNITKLPQAPNSAIYSQVGLSETKSGDVDQVTQSAVNSDNEDSEIEMEEENLLETDDELENFDIDSVCLSNRDTTSPIKNYIGSKIPEEVLKAIGVDLSNPSCSKSTGLERIGPLYDLNADGSIKETTDEVLEALRMFGHTTFRKGQDKAVMRILSGMSTLVTLSTGSGKSLCYQLPAYLYSKYKKCITLVISPLVSLMEDQVTDVPHFLRAHCLHTNQTPQQKMKIMKMISEGEVDVLLVSPEAVVAGERSTGFGSILRQLPPIAFACIDEAHCVSQWSHNFRPSYLMICKVLKQNLGVNCVLGLTATATLPTRMSIIGHLGITDGDRGIISDVPLPDNLILSVSKDECRDSALLQLLLSKRFAACQSVIIYCTRRDECERIAGYLRTCLQDCKTNELENGKKKRKRVNWHAEPYHAGMPASRRRTIQKAFMSNELRIVVATIAFGMGINKPDIRAVIHYNMPRNFESYVQEVGRAGRDNKIAHCHLFLDANGGDQNELKRHIYANSLDRHVIRKLLQRIFVPCSCDKHLKEVVQSISKEKDDLIRGASGDVKARPHICKGHEIGFSIEKTVEALDIPEENISTLLCYMELDNRWGINVLSTAYTKAKVISYGGPKYLKHAAKECPPLAMAIAMEIKNGSFKEDANIIEFSVVDIAAAIGWNSGVVKYQLKNLEWVLANGVSKRSPITVTFYDLGFRIKAPGDFTVDEIDEALDTLYNRSVRQEHTQLIQLQYIFQGLSSVAYNSYGPCCNERFSHDRSDQLKGIIRSYFQNDYPKDLKLELDTANVSDAELEADVISLINMYPENNFSGRNIARIFHGISSPNYPALMWHRCKFWRVHSKTDFNNIVQLANNVIVKRRHT